MKRFMFTILGVSAFFVGVGMVAEKVKAIFKPDEKAVIILKKAPVAIGVENKITTVKSLSVNGRVVSIFRIDGAAPKPEGRQQIRLPLPDKFRRMEGLRFESGNKIKISGNNVLILQEKNRAETADEKAVPEEIKENEAEYD